MSDQWQRVLGNARELRNRARTHDYAMVNLATKADLLRQACSGDKGTNNSSAENDKQYGKEVPSEEERLRVRQLIRENVDLRMALDECEDTLCLIMAKYREKVLDHLKQSNQIGSQVQERFAQMSRNWQASAVMHEQLFRGACTMQRAAHEEDDQLARDAENLLTLRLENETLREIFQAAYFTLSPESVDVLIRNAARSVQLEEKIASDSAKR